MRLVFDIEADNLLPKLSKFHCAGAIDIDSQKEYWFKPHQGREFLELLDSAKTIVAHNAMGYDVPALEKLFNWKPQATVHCTKVMSQLLNYRRFGFGHSLKKWGEFFNDNKIEYKGGFEEFNEDMFTYMKQDVKLLVKVYKHLINEYSRKTKNQPNVGKAIRSEITMDKIMSEQVSNGWKFNVQGAKDLLIKIDDEMERITKLINPHLGITTKIVDRTNIDPFTGKKTESVFGETKKIKFTKSGKYHAHIISFFQLNNECGTDNRPIWGDYCRIDFIGGDIGNTNTVKNYLYKIGWKPDEWNWKNVDGQFIKTTAKLTDTSLEPLGEIGKALSTYYTLRSRKSIIEGWFDYIDKNDRLHGDVFNIGTPTFRQTHKIIANLPSAKATYGAEVRSLFIAEKGYTLVSADSAACQLRLLAHFMKDDNFTKELMTGDIHQINADILNCTRNEAKRFIFAYLYGAGAQKLSGYIGKTVAETKTSVAKYKRSFPKLVALTKKLNDIVEHQGFIIGLDDRPIMLGSDERHKALNYLIQGAEAVVMKYTVNLIHEKLEKASIDSKILLFYHDEVTYEVKEDQAEKAKEIIIECFNEAPKAVGVDLMSCGDCKIGQDYYEVH